jgi:dethiobiotin synthetase
MKGKACFITGTDTGIGKTRVSVGLLKILNAGGHRAMGMKPIASGAVAGPDGLCSDDAVALRAAGPPGLSLRAINPYCFPAPVSPNIAAAEAGASVSVSAIAAAAARLAERADVLVIEGIGGWRVPIGAGLALPDVVRALAAPVVMVVGLRLGCINHACLTAEAIQRDGLRLAGWIGNQLDPEFRSLQQVIHTLDAWIDAPRLALVPYLSEADDEELLAHLRPGVPALLEALSG